MHEMSIASALLEQVLGHAEAAGSSRVERVAVRTGVRQAVVPMAMQAAWEAVREGTIAATAELKLTEEDLAARCRACGRDYAPTLEDYSCPVCGSADPELIAGTTITLEAIDCEVEEDDDGTHQGG